MTTAAEVLSDVPLFANLDDNECQVLAERVDLLELVPGKVLYEYGDPGDWMVVVKRGEIELSVTNKTGEKVVVDRIGPGEFCGEISLLDAGVRTATAKVLTAGEAIIVDRGDLDELLRLRPAAGLDLLGATGKALRVHAQLLRNAASRNVNEEAGDSVGVVRRLADAVAGFSGSITFLILHLFIFAAWIVLNIGALPFGDFDPYPFGLLTMAVSLEAIILSTLLLFSSNRQTARDRIRSDIEYDVNLKAELQIQHLHEKVDQLHRAAADQDRGARPAPQAAGDAGVAARPQLSLLRAARRDVVEHGRGAADDRAGVELEAEVEAGRAAGQLRQRDRGLELAGPRRVERRRGVTVEEDLDGVTRRERDLAHERRVGQPGALDEPRRERAALGADADLAPAGQARDQLDRRTLRGQADQLDADRAAAVDRERLADRRLHRQHDALARARGPHRELDAGRDDGRAARRRGADRLARRPAHARRRLAKRVAAGEVVEEARRTGRIDGARIGGVGVGEARVAAGRRRIDAAVTRQHGDQDKQPRAHGSDEHIAACVTDRARPVTNP